MERDGREGKGREEKLLSEHREHEHSKIDVRGHCCSLPRRASSRQDSSFLRALPGSA